MGDLMKLLNENQTLPENMDFDFDSLGKLINLVNSGKINRGTGKAVLEKVYLDKVDPEKYIEENNLALMTDTGAIRSVIEGVLESNEKSVNEYRGGKTQAFQYLIGQSMRALKGKAPAQEVQKILRELLG